MKVRCRRLPHGRDLPPPRRASVGSAGFDLAAAVDQPRQLAPGERVLIPTGLVLEIPPGWEAQIRPRSGLAVRHGLTVLNSPGTIDSDYRGEVGVLLINLGTEPFTVRRGERIAQAIFAPVTDVEWEEAESLSASERGDGGFGSSGMS